MTPEEKQLKAIARAKEAYTALEIIQRYQDHLMRLVENHDASKSDNASRRDCEAFWKEIDALGLRHLVDKFAK